MLVLILSTLVTCTAPVQDTFNVRELAEYRLTVPVFRRFEHASRLIATASRDHATFERQPLFTRELLLQDDVAEAAARFETRLNNEPALAAALFAADMPAREYTKFMLALFAAHLAHGFMQSGAMRRVPPGVATDNVAFAGAHEKEIAAVFALLGIE